MCVAGMTLSNFTQSPYSPVASPRWKWGGDVVLALYAPCSRAARPAPVLCDPQEEPITSLGRERLLYPCGQQDQPPDYQELFE